MNNLNLQHFGKRAFCFLLAAIVVFSLIPLQAFADAKGITNAKVIMRKGASKEASAVQTIAKGVTVTVTGKNGNWYKVKYSGKSGYMMCSFLNVSTSEKKNLISSLGSAPGVMYPGDSNSDVKKLQQALDILGYYSGKIDGSYGDSTKAAVKAYQKANKLSADGTAGKKTVTSIFGKCASSSKTKAASSSTKTEKKVYKTEVLDWFKDNVSKVIRKGAVFTVKDVLTGKTFTCKRWAGSNHLDAEPKTPKDTSTMKSIYGGSWSWKRRAILILYNGHVYAASMNGMPHGTTTISNNQFNGHFCIHFKNSKTHETKKVDSEHQNKVNSAAKATW